MNPGRRVCLAGKAKEFRDLIRRRAIVVDEFQNSVHRSQGYAESERVVPVVRLVPDPIGGAAA